MNKRRSPAAKSPPQLPLRAFEFLPPNPKNDLFSSNEESTK